MVEGTGCFVDDSELMVEESIYGRWVLRNDARYLHGGHMWGHTGWEDGPAWVRHALVFPTKEAALTAAQEAAKKYNQTQLSIEELEYLEVEGW